MPRLVAVAILFYVGLDFLNDWLVRTRRSMPVGDYAVLLLVFAVTVLVDFVWAVVVGLGAGLVIFVLRYSQISAVRSALSGGQIGSRVERPPAQRELLAVREEELLILVLHGFLFFGTANGLLERIRSPVGGRGRPAAALADPGFRSRQRPRQLGSRQLRQAAPERRAGGLHNPPGRR